MKRMGRSDSVPAQGGVAMSVDDELSASENLLASVLDTGSESALVTDAQRRTIYCNEEFTRVTGYGFHELLGRNCDILQGPETDVKTIAEMRRTLDAGLTFRGRILNYRRDGTTFWNQLTISAVRDTDGAVLNFVSVQLDVTDQMERELATISAPSTTLERLPPKLMEGEMAPSQPVDPAVT